MAASVMLSGYEKRKRTPVPDGIWRLTALDKAANST
jgi:hypothetical protein